MPEYYWNIKKKRWEHDKRVKIDGVKYIKEIDPSQKDFAEKYGKKEKTIEETKEEYNKFMEKENKALEKLREKKAEKSKPESKPEFEEVIIYNAKTHELIGKFRQLSKPNWSKNPNHLILPTFKRVNI
jgi:succinate dehydrogenase flavin-adding protein (antitoxin of CptAB toxin-antitoxin module)